MRDDTEYRKNVYRPISHAYIYPSAPHACSNTRNAVHLLYYCDLPFIISSIQHHVCPAYAWTRLLQVSTRRPGTIASSHEPICGQVGAGEDIKAMHERDCRRTSTVNVSTFPCSITGVGNKRLKETLLSSSTVS